MGRRHGVAAHRAALLVLEDGVEGLLHVGPDVLHVLNAAREAHEVVLDAQLAALLHARSTSRGSGGRCRQKAGRAPRRMRPNPPSHLRALVPVGDDSGLLDQRLDSAQRGRDVGQPAVVDEGRRLLQSAVHLE